MVTHLYILGLAVASYVVSLKSNINVSTIADNVGPEKYLLVLQSLSIDKTYEERFVMLMRL
ncbi:hypothetical protein RJ639_032020 [Escallonia herrerae]|uniref:Uncharacterized protein n=1 Tax=Escallonia herrerae TaxID=1293975 RepID=A0AA89BNI2_9ASTE|nr:hypothetical protein RJ639_032020 [Escallonia herrerae]